MLKLSTKLKSKIKAVFDEMISEWGKTCILVYSPKLVACTCTKNHLNTGVKQTKSPSNCPLCGGEGFKREEVTAEIKMSVVDNPKDFWIKFPADIALPDGIIQTKCLASDLDKIMQATHLIITQSQDNGISWKYVKHSEPTDIYNIIQAEYFYLNWVRSP